MLAVKSRRYKWMNRDVLLLTAWLLLAFCSTIALAAVEYDVIDLGTLGGEWAKAHAINDAGQVVGSSQDADGLEQAFVWQAGRMTGLGFLPGGTNSYALAINRSGQITGRANVSPTSNQAFLFSDGEMLPLGTLGGPNSIGRAINASGIIAGSSSPSNINHNHTFVWQNNELIHVTPYHNFFSCDAYGINNATQVVGITALWANSDRWWAYLWQDLNGNGQHDKGEMTPLGSLGVQYSDGSMSGAAAINNHGQVVGWTSITNTSAPRHAFLITPQEGVWKKPAGDPNPTNEFMRSLGTLGTPANSSWATAINDNSWVVGHSETPAGDIHAFLWRNDHMLNLNTLIPQDSGWILTHATGINNANEIVGYGLHNGAQMRQFDRLGTPVRGHAGVETQGGRADGLQALRQLHGRFRIIAPARAQFDHNRDIHGVRHGGGDVHGQVRLAQQGRASAAFDDFGHGTAHVYVHAEKTFAGDAPGRRSHFFGITSENLGYKAG